MPFAISIILIFTMVLNTEIESILVASFWPSNYRRHFDRALICEFLTSRGRCFCFCYYQRNCRKLAGGVEKLG